jgi:hypothetical protein
MMRSYNPALVDYNSPAFHAGFEQGQARNPRPDLPAEPTTSDVEWASYCEGWLMGSSEPIWTSETLARHGRLTEKETGTGTGVRDMFIGWTRYKHLNFAAAEADDNQGGHRTDLSSATIVARQRKP